METVKAQVTSKGQITLPKALRQKLRIKAGDQVQFTIGSAHEVLLQKQQAPGFSAGLLKQYAKSQPLSLEEMDAAVRDAVTQKRLS